jgi:DNA-binding NarL/FixJ family response regulator
MTIKLLLADDHAVVRAGTRQLLERQVDMQVVGEAADGAEAVNLAAQLLPDVVVMDVRMPVMSGVEATRRIKQELPQVAVLVLTAHDDDEYVDALLDAGANGYLLKTAETDELVRAIRYVASGKRPLDPAVTDRVMARAAGGRPGSESPAGTKRDELDGLTERELEILKLVGRGLTNKRIGRQLFISDRTVQAHLSNIFSKLGVESRTEAAMYAVRRGWVIGDEADTGGLAD